MTRRVSLNAVFCLVLLALSAVAPVSARVESATVVVEGMACPFCAFGVEKRLKKVEGVNSIEVSMSEGSASLRASAEGSIDVVGIPAAVRKAGFTPGTIEVTAVGTVSVEKSHRPLLAVRGTDQKLLLVNLSEEIERKAAEFAAAGVSVRVSGALHVHPEELAGLEAVTIEAVE